MTIPHQGKTKEKLGKEKVLEVWEEGKKFATGCLITKYSQLKRILNYAVQ